MPFLVVIFRMFFNPIQPHRHVLRNSKEILANLEGAPNSSEDNRQTEQTVVQIEYLTGNKRWIDIVIKDGQWLIPIEVKINARDQKNQCADYVKDKKSPVYYLTIAGRMPSDYSTGSLSPDKIRTMIKPISWEKSVIDWLNACIEATGKEHSVTLMNLRQFLSAVKKFCLLGAMDKYRKELDSNRHDIIA